MKTWALHVRKATSTRVRSSHRPGDLALDKVQVSAVRLVLDQEHEHVSRWAAIVSVAEQIDCTDQHCMGVMGPQSVIRGPLGRPPRTRRYLRSLATRLARSTSARRKNIDLHSSRVITGSIPSCPSFAGAHFQWVPIMAAASEPFT